MKYHSPKAFTLVELIVVITILSVLGTIGFLSLQGYSLSSRDSSRISDLSSIGKWLDARIAASQFLPPPSANSIAIYAGTQSVWTQGYAGSWVLDIVSFGWKGLDPLDQTYYTYVLNAASNRYQLMGFLEGGPKVSFGIVPQAYATDYSVRYPFAKGQPLGTILWNTAPDVNRPVQEWYDPVAFTGINLKTYTGSVTAYFDASTSLVNSGALVYGNSSIVLLESSFRQANRVVMASCPSWWTKMGTIHGPTSKCGANVCQVCEASPGMPVPAWTQVAMPSCPSGWTDVAGLSGPAVSCSTTSAVCRVCSANMSTALTTTGLVVIMSSCPAGWSTIGQIVSPTVQCWWAGSDPLCQICQKQ